MFFGIYFFNIYGIPTTINEQNRKKANTCYQQLACTYISLYVCIHPTETKNQIFATHFFFVHPSYVSVRRVKELQNEYYEKSFSSFFSNSIFILLYFYFNKKIALRFNGNKIYLILVVIHWIFFADVYVCVFCFVISLQFVDSRRIHFIRCKNFNIRGWLLDVR